MDKDALLVSIRDAADDLSGFGWVQSPAYAPQVAGGEFRGNKATAAAMRAHLAALPGAACATEPYEDTKIRYLFSHFKVMVPTRRMCFEEPPYMCPGGGASSGAGGAAPPPDRVEL